MAFLGSIGKFVGGLVKPLVSAIPSAAAGFLTGGPAGAFLASAPKLLPAVTGATSLFGGVQQALPQITSFGGPYQLPQQLPQYPAPSPSPGFELPAVPAADVPATLNKDIFDMILRLAGRLGLRIKSVGSVVRIGRRIIAKLLRFARANPGLTIINLLVNLGLAADEATRLIAWYTASTKKHRRIKVTNVKALNRSVRRLEGFRRLSRRVEMALAHRGAARVSRRRCPRCRKNPCCC